MRVLTIVFVSCVVLCVSFLMTRASLMLEEDTHGGSFYRGPGSPESAQTPPFQRIATGVVFICKTKKQKESPVRKSSGS